ncbi:MAG: pentapeptide repeat-containing protein [Anaerolineae bacterium]|nr:pentapeptide repeat-containing protein [Anaerolineae bacterium]
MHITPPHPPHPPHFVMGRIEIPDDELKNMDTKDLAKLLARLAAFVKSTEQTIHSGGSDVLADTIVEKYDRLYQRATEILPDDDYINDDLKVSFDNGNAQKKAQVVLFLARQLLDYLRDMLRQAQRNRSTGDIAGMGRRLKDEIMAVTKSAIQRAMANLDVMMDYDIEIDGKRYHNRSGVNMPGADLAGKEFNEENLRGANFMGANLEECTFIGADMRGANLSGANLQKAIFNEANLEDANLSGIRAGNAEFISANLEDSNMTGANLKGALLNEANMEDARLSGANLADAEAISANFSDANLSGAVLSHAKLSDSNFEDANLNSANLAGADLRQANLGDANLETLICAMLILLGRIWSRLIWKRLI